MSQRVPDVNGWFEVKRNPISRVGVFDYSGRQLGFKTEPEASKIYKVYRPAEELGNPQTLESFKLVPWVDEHAMLGPEAQKIMPSVALPAEQKGIGGVIGQDIEFDGDTLYGNVKVFSDAHRALIDSGKVELSAGYRCKYDMTPGVHPVFGAYDAVQRNIRGNHLASVKEGRMGPSVAVMDSFTFTFDAKDATMADPENKPAAGGGASSMTLEECTKMLADMAPQLAKLQAAFAALSAPPVDPVVDATAKPADPAAATPAAVDAAAAAAVPAALDAVKTGMDSLTATVAGIAKSVAEIKTAQAGAPAAAVAELANRDALATELSKHVGTFDHAAMDSAAVVKYGVEKLGLKPAAGHERTALEAYMQGAGKTGNTVRIGTGMDAVVGARPAFLSKHLERTE